MSRISSKLDTILSLNLYEIVALLATFCAVIFWVGTQGRAIEELVESKNSHKHFIIENRKDIKEIQIMVEGRLSKIEATQVLILEELKKNR